MSKKSFIAKASVIAFAVLSIVFFKPTDVKAYNNGCDIVSPSTMYEKTTDEPKYSTPGTWQSWVDWYAGKGYTYVNDTTDDHPADYYNGNPCYWMKLQNGSELYYAYMIGAGSDLYTAAYRHWIYVDTYYYTNDIGIVYRNTWVHTRTEDDFYQPTDAHGYFVFNNSGQMCTGWHKDSNDRWYYMRIDHTYNKDGPSMKVGVDGGFLWETVKNPTAYSEGLYYFTGINVTTNVYIMGTDGSYPTKVPDADKKLDFVKVDDIQPLSGAKTYKPNADFVKGKYENIKYLSLNTEKSASLAETKQINIVNGDYKEYSIEAFNYYVDRSKYKQTVQVRYQKADGNWGDYSNVICADYYYGVEVSWSRNADNTYNAASIKYTVTEVATKKVDVKRKQHTQTINFNTYGASGTYTSPTHKTTYLNKKTYNSYYGSTFNAKSHGADYGNVAGYHWWKVDNNSWIVTGDASTNSYYYPNKYRLYVDVAGGSGTNGNFDMEYGTSINLGTPTRTGWAFKGWDIVTNNSTNSSLSSNQFTMGYNNSYKYQTYVAVPTVKIIANWEDVTAPAGNDTILKATNPTKTTTYASVTASTPKADTPWVNNNVLLTFTSKDNESGLSGLGIYEKITSGWKAISSKTLGGATTAQSITYTDSKEGSYTYYGKATDNASATHGSPANKITSTAELTVHIDKTMPVYKEELLTTDIKHGSLPHGMTTGGVVVDTETGDVNINELSSKITVEVSDENSTLADSTDVSGIKKVTLVVYKIFRLVKRTVNM